MTDHEINRILLRHRLDLPYPQEILEFARQLNCKWIATDRNGVIHGYEVKPYADDGEWFGNSFKVEYLGAGLRPWDYQKTLFEVPEMTNHEINRILFEVPRMTDHEINLILLRRRLDLPADAPVEHVVAAALAEINELSEAVDQSLSRITAVESEALEIESAVDRLLAFISR